MSNNVTKTGLQTDIMANDLTLHKAFTALSEDAFETVEAYTRDILVNLPKNSRRAVISDFKKYCEFCQKHIPPLEPLSADLKTSKQVLMAFARHMANSTYKKLKNKYINEHGELIKEYADTHYARATINRYISSVSHVFSAAEMPNPLTTKYCKKGISALLNNDDFASEQKQARALREEDLDLINDIAPRETLKEKRDILMLNIAFEGLLRVDEVINIQRHMINVDDATLSLGKTKTDQEAKGHSSNLSDLTIRLYHDYIQAIDADVYSYDNLKLKLSSSDGKKLKDYLFRSVSNDGKRLRPIRLDTESKGRIDRNAVVKAYKQLTALAGLGTIYSGHSPRVGAAVSLAEFGEDGLTIQREGRWTTSQMPVRYTEKVKSKKLGMARMRKYKK